jgi:predicted 3-demethylubiquinone-9 3-methyltransferase (glyoxalase superfamily)
MQKITTFLTFNDQAEAAVTLYTSVFRNSKIVSTMPGPGGGVMSATFELEGQRFIALNGGPSFTFAQGMSLLVNCETQQEIDDYWARLTAGGGKPGQCGWLTDRFGVTWQIIPSVLGKLLGDKDPQRAGRAVQAMLAMTRLDIARLQAAADGK